MFVWTVQDLIGLVMFALFMSLALLVWLLILLSKLRAWVRRRWTFCAARWSKANG